MIATNHTLQHKEAGGGVMDESSRENLWDYIDAQLHCEAERVVVFSSFVMGMKPSEIYRQRGDLFTSVDDVYRVKRGVIERLLGNPELRRLI